MPLVLPPMDFLAGAAAIPIHGKRLRGGAGGGNSWHLACMQVRQLYFDLAVPHNQHGFLVPGSAGADSYNAMHYSAGKGK